MKQLIAIGVLALAALAPISGPAFGEGAEDWQRLDGPGVTQSLQDVELKYDVARQIFYKSGRTLYDSGRPSWGYWAVRGDQYCSQWPPSNGWDCYDLERHVGGDRFRFISETGYITEGIIVE